MKRLLILAILLVATVGCNRGRFGRAHGWAPWRCGAPSMQTMPCMPCMPCDPCSNVSTGAGVSGCSTCATGGNYEQGVILNSGPATNPPTITPANPGS